MFYNITFDNKTGKILNARSSSIALKSITNGDISTITVNHIDFDALDLYHVDTTTKTLIKKPDADAIATTKKWDTVKLCRNTLLANSDWTQAPDNALTAQKKQQWIAYRQALRDITNQPDPAAIVWPKSPDQS